MKLGLAFFLLAVFSPPLLASQVLVHGNQDAPTRAIVTAIGELGKAGPLANRAATSSMRDLIYHQMKAEPNGENIVPGVRDFRMDAALFSRNPRQEFFPHSGFALKGSEIDAMQRTAKVYYDPDEYSGRTGLSLLERTLRGQTTPQEAFKAKWKIVVSENYMLYHTDGTPVPGGEKVPFKIFSQPGINVAYGENGHDDLDYQRFVASPGRLKEREFLNFMKANLRFQLKAMQREGIQVPVLVALGGGAFSHGFQPKYSELVAQAYRQLLETERFGFKAVVFALPKFHPEDNLDRYHRAFNGYSGTPPVILADTDLVEIAHRLGRLYRVGIVNPADSYSIAGMYWNGGDIALEESLALRTTMLLTQHLRINPRIVDRSSFVPIEAPGRVHATEGARNSHEPGP